MTFYYTNFSKLNDSPIVIKSSSFEGNVILNAHLCCIPRSGLCCQQKNIRTGSGLDPSSYKRRMAAALEDDETGGDDSDLSSIKSIADFSLCDPFDFDCSNPQCKHRNVITGPLVKNVSGLFCVVVVDFSDSNRKELVK